MTNYEYLKTLTVEEMAKWLHELCDLNEIAPDEKWLFEMLNNNCFEQRETPIRGAMVNGVK